MLRKEIADDTLPDTSFYIVISRTERETVGILVDNVNEVVPVCRLTPVPDAAPFFVGLLNLGGTMVPVLDLAMRISNTDRQTRLSDLIIICTTPKGPMGLIVCEVVGIQQITKAAVQNVEGNLAGAPFLLGAAELDKQTVLLLSLTGLSANTDIFDKVKS